MNRSPTKLTHPWLAAPVVFLLALGLRGARLDRVAVEHFDEGVYASNVWFSADQGYEYPQRYLYAPPLVPAVLELCMVFMGTAESVLWPGVIVGALLAAGCCLLATAWFGNRAGWAAGLLAAGCDLPVLYSRTALTEVWVCAFLLLAIGCGWRAISRGAWGWAVAAGLATSAAWWSKYNGWLPLPILAVAASLWALRTQPSQRPSLTRLGLIGGLIVTVALAGWLPVLWDLQPTGGYAQVAANHAQYLGDLASWPYHAQRQLANLRSFESWATWLAVAASMLAASVPIGVNPRATPADPRQAAGRRQAVASPHRQPAATPAWWSVLALPLAAGATAAGLGLFGVLAGGALLAAVRVWRTGPREPQTRLAMVILFTWLVSLLAATPFYTPYPRLTLPLMLGGFLAWGLLAAELNRLVRSPADARLSQRRCGYAAWAFAVVSGTVWLTTGGQFPAPNAAGGWQDRTSVRDLARTLAEAIRSDAARTSPGPLASSGTSPPVETMSAQRTEPYDAPPRPNSRDAAVGAYLYGEPALLFHLCTQAVPSVPVVDVELVQPFGTTAMYFIVRADSADHRRLQREAPDLPSRLRLVGTFASRPSPLVASNRYDLRRQKELPADNYLLYRVVKGQTQ